MLRAFGPRQQSLLILLLENKSGLTIDRIAGELGITRTAVRDHLSALERDQFVSQGALTVTGGRPGRTYGLTAAGLALFPRHYDLLTRLLLRNLAAKAGQGGARSELRGLGETIAADLKHRVGTGSLHERARRIQALMAELGYQTREPVADGGSVEIEAFNCVYHDLAQENPDICQVDIALLEGLSGAAVEHRACMAKGDNSCRFCLREGSPAAG